MASFVKREPRPNRRRAEFSGTLIGTCRGARGAPASCLDALAYTHLTAVGARSRLSTGVLSEQRPVSRNGPLRYA